MDHLQIVIASLSVFVNKIMILTICQCVSGNSWSVVS